MEKPERNWRRWPPLPANQPNPVGIDGVLEGLCPPYVTIDEAVDQILEQKYGGAGAYGDEAIFRRPYQRAQDGRTYLAEGERYSTGAIEYTREVCHYIYDTYGRFPAHVNAFHLPGVWLQFSHLEMEFYDRFFDPALYRRQAAHHEMWGDH
jgi:hypothetical protein